MAATDSVGRGELPRSGSGSLAAVRRARLLRRIGKRLEQVAKRCLSRALAAVMPVRADETLDAVRDVARVLLVRPNFRIGNTLMTAPLVPALAERFPGASIEMLAADTTATLLEHLPLSAVHVMSRRFVLRPWEFVRLFRTLRSRRFDVAIDGGMGSFSGPLFALLAGARHRIGWSGAGDRFLTVRLEAARGDHVYDSAPALARKLSQSCADRPIYEVSVCELVEAEARLAATSVYCDGAVRPFIALFVGGHLAKRWPAECWIRLVSELARRGARFLVFAGPEEADLALRLEVSRHPVVSPGGLRAFAAMLAQATLVVTPDTGALHLSVALGRPTVALMREERSLRFRPRGASDVTLMRPNVVDVVRALMGHSGWPAVSRCRPDVAPGTSGTGRPLSGREPEDVDHRQRRESDPEEDDERRCDAARRAGA